ncbi:MAG: 30S ribosomal protein S4 [Nanoarchaeota archaeon]|nr:30S ribosomal protein S4 [Nanoarchaeota archaeon]
MGDPKKQRKKYEGPRHPWEGERIKLEKELVKEYGLKNKKEIWKMNSFLKKIKNQAKDLIGKKGTVEIEEEVKRFLIKLSKLNLVNPTSKIEDVLDIKIKDILERRLQTILLRKNLAHTINQARQFIVHGHIQINEKKLNVPSYMITKDEEGKIAFIGSSPLADLKHSERIYLKKEATPKLEVPKELPKEKKEISLEKDNQKNKEVAKKA